MIRSLPNIATSLINIQRVNIYKLPYDSNGVFVKSVGKWFHTNDESCTQYILLRTMKELPVGLRWKTMENDFVLMTRELLDEMTTQMVLDEQADFANAERHKAAMLKAENPLEYDYSDGWTANYEQPAAELEEA